MEKWYYVLSLSIWSAVLRTFVVKVRDKKGKKKVSKCTCNLIWLHCCYNRLKFFMKEYSNYYVCKCNFIHFFEFRVNGVKVASWFEFKQVNVKLTVRFCQILWPSLKHELLFRSYQAWMLQKNFVKMQICEYVLQFSFRIHFSPLWIAHFVLRSFPTLPRNNILCPKNAGNRSQWNSAQMASVPIEKKSKSWGPFWSYQLDSTANPAHLPKKWAKGAELAEQFSW